MSRVLVMVVLILLRSINYSYAGPITSGHQPFRLMSNQLSFSVVWNKQTQKSDLAKIPSVFIQTEYFGDWGLKGHLFLYNSGTKKHADAYFTWDGTSLRHSPSDQVLGLDENNRLISGGQKPLVWTLSDANEFQLDLRFHPDFVLIACPGYQDLPRKFEIHMEPKNKALSQECEEIDFLRAN